jgi:hypothetical protein
VDLEHLRFKQIKKTNEALGAKTGLFFEACTQTKKSWLWLNLKPTCIFVKTK